MFVGFRSEGNSRRKVANKSQQPTYPRFLLNSVAARKKAERYCAPAPTSAYETNKLYQRDEINFFPERETFSRSF